MRRPSRLLGLVAAALLSLAATPSRTVTTESHSEPESVTVAPDGALILGSATKPVIYRAGNGKLFLAENNNGRASMLTIEGDKDKVTVLLDGLVKPTAIEPAGDILWIGDRGADKAVAIPLP